MLKNMMYFSVPLGNYFLVTLGSSLSSSVEYAYMFALNPMNSFMIFTSNSFFIIKTFLFLPI